MSNGETTQMPERCDRCKSPIRLADMRLEFSGKETNGYDGHVVCQACKHANPRKIIGKRDEKR